MLTLIEIVLGLISPILLLIVGLVTGAADLAFAVFGRKQFEPETAPKHDAATVVIPNWNGRELLERFLPSVVTALAGNPRNEILIVDNASTDGSVDFLIRKFPQVHVLALRANRGFGGGSNAGFEAATNDIVVLLNSDMRVEPDFLGPLLEPFSDPLMFSVSCQIFLSDLAKRREETGQTECWWEQGRLRVSHRDDPTIQEPYPCAYAGGGSSAIDRRKFLQLGGFDELLRPFYYEDTDLGLMAWKRGWKLLYQPKSVVFHEHRGTIGKTFSRAYIESVLKKNVILYCWKNIHDWRWFSGHLLTCFTSSTKALLSGERQGRHTFTGIGRAFLQLGGAVQARWRAHSLAKISDREAFRRSLGGYYRDRFQAAREEIRDRLRVLFVTPYPIEPPTHGGGVFMSQTLRQLVRLISVHLLGFLDTKEQLPHQKPLERLCDSAQFRVRYSVVPRLPATWEPHAIREFHDREFSYLLHRTIYTEKIDVVQIEYTILGQYAEDFKYIPCFLFEHDIFFQSLSRRIGTVRNVGRRLITLLEYVRMVRYELDLLRRVHRVQLCSKANAEFLLPYAPEILDKIDHDCRAVIDTSQYRFVPRGRDPDTLLFLGSFRHLPNLEALEWFTRLVLPRIVAARPTVRFVIVGADPPASLRHLRSHPNIEFTGFVEDVREPLERYALFVCPILSGSGVRVKLLEAFSAGIPVISTTIGAEGLATVEDRVCEIGDTPESFSKAIIYYLENPDEAGALAERARRKVVAEHDSAVLTRRLVDDYREEVYKLRSTTVATSVRPEQQPR